MGHPTFGVARRVRRVAITPWPFVELMKHGLDAVDVIENPLPADASFVKAVWDVSTDSIWLFVESGQFDEVHEGEPVPIHPRPLFKKRAM